MKQIRIYMLLSLIVGMSLTACSDWLDVDPKDKVLEDKMFETPKGINDVLNGFYQSMMKENLYGGQMSSTTIEILGQYYNYPHDEPTQDVNLRPFYYLGNYKYGQKEVMDKFSYIWRESYEIIFGINNFIDKLQGSNVLAQDTKETMLGEAHALRAFLHLDMLRLFGPVYKTHPGSLAIPYNDKPKVNTYAPLSAQEVMQKIMTDITTAESLLKNDPILTEGILYIEDENEHIRLSSEEIFNKYYRNRRMNVYAVKALKARALAYQGNISEAAQEARKIIDEASTLFPFTKESDVADKRFYTMHTEVLFGVENLNMYTRWNEYTNGTLLHRTYTVNSKNLTKNIFTGTAIDLEDTRRGIWETSKINKELYISRKYEDYGFKTYDANRLYQPLMRITEMHYLIAESYIENNNIQGAIEKINEIGVVRGWKTKINFSNTMTKEEAYNLLVKEYYKEFYGEGQVFFYHKRKNNKLIYCASDSETINTIDIETLDQNPYLIPLPNDETDV